MKKCLPYYLFLLLLAPQAHAQDLSQYGWKKGIKISGGLNLNTVSYNAAGILGRRDPFNWFASGNLNINLFGYSLPFSFALSNASRNYTQPFNRIQFRPYWKWIKGYWGNTSMSFSPLTLSGHLFNGYGVEMNKGRWNFAAMYGRLREAVPYDPILKNTGTAAFKRKGWGFKGGYRFKNGDELQAIYFTAKDDTTSLTAVPLEAQLTPKQNHVVSISGKKKLFKKFNIQAEYALSGIITDNTAAAEARTITGKSFLGFLLPKKDNIRFYDAVKASFGYNARHYGLQLQYERVSPEYQTLGAYFFNNDLVNYTLAPTLSLLKGKLNLGGNAGVQFNNLDRTKTSTTRRFVGSMNASYTPGEKWNYSLAYNNFTTFTNIRPQPDPFFNNQLDSLNFYQVNSSFTGSISHSFGGKAVKKNISLNTSYQKAADAQTGTQNGRRASDFINVNAAYSHTLAKKGLSINGAANYSRSDAPGMQTVFYGPNLGLSAPLFKKLIRSSAGISYNKNTANGVSNSAVINLRAAFNYNPKPKKTNDTKTTGSDGTTGKKTGLVQATRPWKGKQNMSLNMSYMKRLPTAAQPAGIRELTVTFNWSYNF